MKTLKVLAAMLLAVVFATPAFAQSTNWSGPYVGINVGHGQGKYEEIPDFKRDQAKVNGEFFGVQWGYNHQFDRLVVGLETDIQKGSMNGSRTTDFCPGCTGFTDVAKDTMRLDWFGTTRVRIGYPVGRFLPYVTGGVAYGVIKKSSREDTAATGRFAFSDSFSSSETQTAVGGVYGGGLDYALNSKWSVRGEWLRVNLGVFKSQSSSSMQEVALKTNVFRMAVNYRF